jgi:hypothetical protein
MLDPKRVLAALEAKRDQFSDAIVLRRQELAALSHALEAFRSMSRAEVEAQLAGITCPGARPTVEHDRYDGLVVPFAYDWANHRQAREWALGVLQDVPTLAVDGSQITPSKDISIPVGVVQVGWFENHHSADGTYTKDLLVEVLPPDELAEDEGQVSGFPDWKINWRRFELEVTRLAEYMKEHVGSDPRPVCFFDGSLVISFVQHMRPERQQLYVDAIVHLLHVSEETGVPLIGYVDTSYANDLTAMLTHLADATFIGRVSDAAMLRPMMKWGDRTRVHICARDDRVLGKYYEQVCFAYLKTTADNPPARVDFPRWLFETDAHERVLDIVRAECIVGTGYPYALETADVTAVLSMQDREYFYALFQQFAEREKLPLRFSRKAMSKRQRR